MYSPLRLRGLKVATASTNKYKIMPVAEKWMEFEIIMLSGTRQTQASTTWLLLCDKSRFKLSAPVCLYM